MESVDNIHRPLRKMLLNNFLGGIAWGLGATIGLSVVLALLALVLNNVNLVPLVGGFLSEVLDFMVKHNQNLKPE